MREIDAREVAVLVEGLPEVMRTEEVAYAIEVYVKTRLVIYNHEKILPCIGLMRGKARDVLTICVIADKPDDLRRDIAVYTERSLRQQWPHDACRSVPCVFEL